MSKVCDPTGMVEERMNRVLTQYRESPNLLSIIRRDLEQEAEILVELCELLDYFDLDTAVGDQLTIIGKRLGFPRCHCICNDNQPKFGFNCGGKTGFLGFCEGGVWAACDTSGVGEICIVDDVVYRRYLRARRYQLRGLWDYENLKAAVQHIWGAQASVWSLDQARVVIVPGRALTKAEQALVQIALRVLPIAPGITPYVSLTHGRVFGFGSGWSGFCQNAQWLCPQEVDPYGCTTLTEVVPEGGMVVYNNDPVIFEGEQVIYLGEP